MANWIRKVVTTTAAAGVIGAGTGAAEAQNPKVELEVAKRGKITIELYQKDAPKTVAHILALCKKGFYDGILVHRVEPGFVVQAGDPQTKTQGVNGPTIGSGGSGRNIPFETSKKTHEQWSLGMALSAPRSATGDSQWFINLNPNHQLDGDYCVFGRVVKGMEIVPKIAVGDKIVRMAEVKKK